MNPNLRLRSQKGFENDSGPLDKVEVYPQLWKDSPRTLPNTPPEFTRLPITAYVTARKPTDTIELSPEDKALT